MGQRPVRRRPPAPPASLTSSPYRAFPGHDGGKPGSGGFGSIFVNGSKIANGRISRTQPYLFSADEGADVGMDEGTPVSEDYQVPAKFTGTIEKVTINVKPVATADQPKVDQNNAEGSAKEADFD